MNITTEDFPHVWSYYFDYDLNSPSGLIWKNPQGKAKKGNAAGTKEDNCWRVGLHGKRYKVHRIVWFLIHKVLLNRSEQIDHINRNPFDNRIENLRVVSQKLNNRNKNKTKNNRTGVTGVGEIYKNGDLKFISCSWYDNLGKDVSVNFNVNKIGRSLALKFAKELREAKLKEMSESMGYTVDHGT